MCPRKCFRKVVLYVVAKEKSRSNNLASFLQVSMSTARPRTFNTHQLVTLNPRSRENVMRSALEFLTGKAFVKIRPPWLRNEKTGRCLEIDAWCEELKLACEFQGYQHTVFPNRFHKSFDDFLAQQQRDRFKATALKAMGIRLLEVPHTVCAEEIPSYLAERLAPLSLLWTESHAGALSDVREESASQLCGSVDMPVMVQVKSRTEPKKRTPQCVDMSQCIPGPPARPASLTDGLRSPLAPRWDPFDWPDEFRIDATALPREPPATVTAPTGSWPTSMPVDDIR